MGPLHNKTIGITRQPKQAKWLVQAIRQKGGKALLLPTVATCATENTADRDRVMAALSTYQWLIFSSENAVKYFLAQLPEDLPRQVLPKLAAVGRKTAQALQNAGFYVDLVPPEFSAKGLLKVFSVLGIEQQRFLLPTSNLARDELPQGLRALGAQADVVEFYRTVPNPQFNTEQFWQLLRQKELNVLTFFSPSAFNFLIRLAGEEVLTFLRDSQLPLAAIGPTTASAIKRYGLPVAIQPSVYDGQHLLEALNVYFSERNM